jgi:tetratricopeptide (TPR) repeat protein
MSRLLLSLIFFFACIGTYSQAKNDDTIVVASHVKQTDTSKVIALLDTMLSFEFNDPARSIRYGIAALAISTKLNYVNGNIGSLLHLSSAFASTGNFSTAMEYCLKGLYMAEKTGNLDQILMANAFLAGINIIHGEYEETIRYCRKILELARDYPPSDKQLIFGFLGQSFFKLDHLDSALFYGQRAYEYDLLQTKHWSIPYYTLAGIHTKLKHYQLAVEFYRTGLTCEMSMVDIIKGHIGLANVFYDMGLKDSSIVNARKSIEMAERYSFPLELAEASAIAKNIYEKQARYDSAYFYQKMMLAANDSLFSRDKVRQVQNLTFHEQLRQLDIQESELKTKSDRKHNLQYAAIAIGLITFTLLFFVLSRSIIVKEKFIRFFGILGLLAVFEFINLFIHPYLGDLTGHTPVLMLIILICIGALLVPLHHRLEKWITSAVIKKNKAIRLAAAKKTIATLEGS